MSKQKKAAFEMSISTIVILVIAVIMLIMGLVFVRTTMCKGLNLAVTSLDGAEKEINKLFGEGQGEISCMGVQQPLNIVPGEYNIVGCGFRYSGGSKKYIYSFKIVSVTDIDNNPISGYQTWVTEKLTNRDISSGGSQVGYGTFAIRPPEGTPEGIVVIQMDATGYPTQTMRLYIKRASFVQKTVC